MNSWLDILIFFGCAHGRWKFPGQGLNQSHSSENVRSLTAEPPKNSNTFFFLLFRAKKRTSTAYGSSQATGQFGATAAGQLYHSHSNSEAELHLQPTPWLMAIQARPGIEPASSWILVGFVSAAPQWELPDIFFLMDEKGVSESGMCHKSQALRFLSFFSFLAAPVAYGSSLGPGIESQLKL